MRRRSTGAWCDDERAQMLCVLAGNAISECGVGRYWMTRIFGIATKKVVIARISDRDITGEFGRMVKIVVAWSALYKIARTAVRLLTGSASCGGTVM